jgi:hypothetical protein
VRRGLRRLAPGGEGLAGRPRARRGAAPRLGPRDDRGLAERRLPRPAALPALPRLRGPPRARPRRGGGRDPAQPVRGPGLPPERVRHAARGALRAERHAAAGDRLGRPAPPRVRRGPAALRQARGPLDRLHVEGRARARHDQARLLPRARRDLPVLPRAPGLPAGLRPRPPAARFPSASRSRRLPSARRGRAP